MPTQKECYQESRLFTLTPNQLYYPNIQTKTCSAKSLLTAFVMGFGALVCMLLASLTIVGLLASVFTTSLGELWFVWRHGRSSLKKNFSAGKTALAENWAVSAVGRWKYFGNWCYMTRENRKNRHRAAIFQFQQPECTDDWTNKYSCRRGLSYELGAA